MRLSFAKQPSPVLIGVIRKATPREAIAAIKNAAYHGATGIDLHLSCLEEQYRTVSAIKEIVDACPLPILALNYSQTIDYREIVWSEEERVELLLKALEAGAAAIDIQGYTFDLPSKSAYTGAGGFVFTRNNPKEVVTDEQVVKRQKELIDRVHAMGGEVLLSTHPGISMNAEEVLALAKYLEERNPDVIKIVGGCEDENELAEAFKTMLLLKKEIKCKVSFHCYGKAGKLTRVINPVLGGYLVFCSDGYDEASNFEQPDLITAKAAIENVKKTLI